MEPLEVEFFAEKEEITIIPNFSENKICLISVSESSDVILLWCHSNLHAHTGGLWTLQPFHAYQGTTLVGHQSETETQVQNRATSLALCW